MCGNTSWRTCCAARKLVRDGKDGRDGGDGGDGGLSLGREALAFKSPNVVARPSCFHLHCVFGAAQIACCIFLNQSGRPQDAIGTRHLKAPGPRHCDFYERNLYQREVEREKSAVCVR